MVCGIGIVVPSSLELFSAISGELRVNLRRCTWRGVGDTRATLEPSAAEQDDAETHLSDLAGAFGGIQVRRAFLPDAEQLVDAQRVADAPHVERVLEPFPAGLGRGLK